MTQKDIIDMASKLHGKSMTKDDIHKIYPSRESFVSAYGEYESTQKMKSGGKAKKMPLRKHYGEGTGDAQTGEGEKTNSGGIDKSIVAATQLASFTGQALAKDPNNKKTWQMAGQGAAMGASVGSFVPFIGTAIGAAVGGIGGAVLGGVAKRRALAEEEKRKEMLRNQANDMLQDVKFSSTDIFSTKETEWNAASVAQDGSLMNLPGGAKGNVYGPPMKEGGKVKGKSSAGMSEGGSVIGPGGPKDDAIKTTLKKGSVVVPAENAGIAEALRADLLPKQEGKMKAAGDVPVALSNQEHVFTPQEKKVMEKQIKAAGLNPQAIWDMLIPNPAPGNELSGGTKSLKDFQSEFESDRKTMSPAGFANKYDIQSSGGSNTDSIQIAYKKYVKREEVKSAAQGKEKSNWEKAGDPLNVAKGKTAAAEKRKASITPGTKELFATLKDATINKPKATGKESTEELLALIERTNKNEAGKRTAIKKNISDGNNERKDAQRKKIITDGGGDNTLSRKREIAVIKATIEKEINAKSPKADLLKLHQKRLKIAESELAATYDPDNYTYFNARSNPEYNVTIAGTKASQGNYSDSKTGEVKAKAADLPKTTTTPASAAKYTPEELAQKKEESDKMYRDQMRKNKPFDAPTPDGKPVGSTSESSTGASGGGGRKSMPPGYGVTMTPAPALPSISPDSRTNINKAIASAGALKEPPAGKVTEPTKPPAAQEQESNTLSMGEILSLGQALTGMLAANKERPLDKPNPIFTARVAASIGAAEKAKGEAEYGFTYEQRQSIGKGLEDSRRQAMAGTVQSSAGSGGVAGALRSISQDKNKALLGIESKDAELKLMKQGRMDQTAAQADNMSVALQGTNRQIFQDDLNDFWKNQSASSELINAGLSNFFNSIEQRKVDKQKAEREQKQPIVINMPPVTPG